MRILFVQEHYFVKLGYLELSGILKERGHNVDIYIQEIDKDIKRKIVQFEPELVVLNAFSPDKKWVELITSKIKEVSSVKVVLGGPLATFSPEIINLRSIDYICIGEGYEAIEELATALSKGKLYERIANLWYKEKGKIKKNALRRYFQGIENLPLPFFGLYNKYKRKEYSTYFITSWECPYPCSFCFQHVMRRLYKNKGWKIRRKSPQRVIQEIKTASKEISLSRIIFSDDTFTLDKNWVLAFSKLYKKNFEYPYYINTRADLLDESLIKALSSSNCKGVYIGVEAGNEYLRNKILKKQLSIDALRKSSVLLKNYNIKRRFLFMFGLPEETIENSFESLKIIRSLKPNAVISTTLKLFPKLDLTNRLKSLRTYSEKKEFDKRAIKGDFITKEYKKIENFCLLFSLNNKIYLPDKVIRFLISLPLTKIYYLIHMIMFGIDEINFFQLKITEIPGYIKGNISMLLGNIND